MILDEGIPPAESMEDLAVSTAQETAMSCPHTPPCPGVTIEAKSYGEWSDVLYAPKCGADRLLNTYPWRHRVEAR